MGDVQGLKTVRCCPAFCEAPLVLRDAETPRAEAGYRDELSQPEMNSQVTHMVDWGRGVQGGNVEGMQPTWGGA